MIRIFKITVLILFILTHLNVEGQQILLDRGVQANGLWCFPLITDQSTYLYLPSRSRLAVDNDSLPQFSYMRYVLEKEAEENTSSTITQADGGGILHFLILYDTPEEQISGAENVLKRRFENDSLKIRGPVVFESGRYALISSIINEENGKKEPKLLAVGEAPVLENSKLALSFELDPVRSKLLMESFKMATPDLSLAFEMGFSGLTDAYEAELEIDWSKVYNSQQFGAGGTVYFIGADVEMGFEELRKNNSIKLTTTGSDESMESLLHTVYSKLMEIMFNPVEPASVPEGERGGLEDAMAALISSDGLLSSGNTTGFGAHVSYEMKQSKASGQGHLTFNGRSTVKRKHYITFNAGNLFKKYGTNEQIFKDVPLWDPAFQQREIYVGIDGNLEREFNRMVNSVTVKLNKKHEDGTQTTRELLVDKDVFLDSLGKLSTVYLNHKDDDRLKWLEYEYQTQWQFTGGGGFTSDWMRSSSAMINLFVPYQRRTVSLEGDLNGLVAEGVRAISVQIKYPFFNEMKPERRTIRPGDDLSTKSFEITLPNNQEEIDYTVTWMMNDGQRPSVSGKDSFGLIFIDELPNQ